MALVVGDPRTPGALPNKNPGQIPDLLRFGLGDIIDAIPAKQSTLLLIAEEIICASATKIMIPSGHIDALKRFANANAEDGKILKNALAQDPSYYRDGLLLGGNGAAAAITFGNSIFFRSAIPDLGTYIHEMVHIHQYARVGPFAFLTSYFQLSMATIIWRAINGRALNPMSSSSHEKQAYQLEARFNSWIAQNP
ncbi:MAG: hypothetical protein IPK63_06790 [Candidatus Competibacteraceae bacterium]|nr:hypothetical protein [Candidatus Competibacteraceae bacterium]